MRLVTRPISAVDQDGPPRRLREGTVETRDHILPHVWHSITVISKDGKVNKLASRKSREWYVSVLYGCDLFTCLLIGLVS